ncbi:uncharacterized protein LAJ45_05760 [Morchella importuna]|uniref:Uncharacterized protein n=1 Tax=Morchella conica CCBAS932 TaxID=1392247 RepID=A0A3N4KCF4_9PEZI|nr:uncharacterized protein LAJ45_05760 [Morchella importuna]KAH8150074.1 hypothetical protein LAJ45_05760 [Morchella importuna]RPB08186.1 hypothetical protein P167DRAFT_608931 [Morchella conica CCBAS932]
MQITYSVVAFVMAIAGTNAVPVAGANAAPVTTFAGPLTLDFDTCTTLQQRLTDIARASWAEGELLAKCQSCFNQGFMEYCHHRSDKPEDAAGKHGRIANVPESSKECYRKMFAGCEA